METINLSKILEAINAGESIDSIAHELQVSRSLLYIRLREYCKASGLEMPKKKRGRKKKFIFE